MLFRSIHSAYLKRNYLFGLDKGRTIDSAAASNETRFINHPLEGTEPNCEAAGELISILVLASSVLEADQSIASPVRQLRASDCHLCKWVHQTFRAPGSEADKPLMLERHIEAQEELFFSYGEDFFIADTSEDDESQKESDDGQTAARVRGVVKAPLPTTW